MEKRGFTIIEVLVAIVLVGIAIASLVAANVSFTKANSAGTNLSIAEFLIEQIRGRTTMVSFSGLSSFDNAQYSPPIGANGQVLSDLASYSQQVTVENVSNSNFEQVVSESDFVRVTVKVLLNSKEISSVSWIRADTEN